MSEEVIHYKLYKRLKLDHTKKTEPVQENESQKILRFEDSNR